MRSWELGDVFVLRQAGFPFDWLEELGLGPEEGAWSRDAYRSRRENLRERLRERAGDPRVREAVFLSNPDMYENVWAPYATRPLRRANAKERRVERQIYTYLQRLCAKNETASFFGPMGYGAADEGAVFELESSPRPARRVLFAFWGIEELARAAVRDKTLPPRRVPLPEKSFEAFEALVAHVRVRPESAAKRLWLERLGRLEALRMRFAAGALDDRRHALAELEEAFAAWTGTAPRRGAGSLYADRLLLYEEAESPWRIRVGPELLRSLSGALGPALELSAAYGERVQADVAREACACLDDEPTTFVRYGELAQGALPQRLAQPALEIDGGEREMCLPADLSGASEPGGRYALVDLCLAAASPADIAAERFGLVLSSLHHHLLLWSWLAAFHPDRSRFEAAARSWIEEQQASSPLLALDVKRRNKAFYAFPGPRVTLSESDGDGTNGSSVDAGRLRVARAGDTPVLLTEDGTRIRLYLPLADLVTYPPLAALSHPLVLRPQLASRDGHVPRALVGDVVYQRERWHVRLDGSDRLDDADFFRAVHERRRTGGWPRFCFVRVAGERKPVFVDFESPFALEVLRHVARGAEEVLVEEMLPAPEDLWLRDAAGRRYTCELRMQAVRREAGA